MSNDQRQLICITGPDGSGKSTIIKKLVSQLNDVAVCSIWDAFAGQGSGLFSSKEDIDNYICALSSHSRTLFLAHAMLCSIEEVLKTEAKIVLINAYYYKYFSTELCLGADEKLIHNLTNLFPSATKTIFLQVLPSNAALRKSKYSRYECGCKQASTNTFETFQTKYAVTFERFIQPDWLVLNTDAHPDVLCRKAIDFITNP